MHHSFLPFRPFFIMPPAWVADLFRGEFLASAEAISCPNTPFPDLVAQILAEISYNFPKFPKKASQFWHLKHHKL
jgi:hypothetical protein